MSALLVDCWAIKQMDYSSDWSAVTPPPSWTLLSRYGVGVFLVIGTLVVLLDDEDGRQDVALKALAAAVSVGAGVATGHLLDYLKEI